MLTNNRLLTIARFSLIEAMRDRFMLLILAGLFLGLLLAVFVGELAITETVAMQTAILAYLLRLFAVFTVSLFVITSMLREFNDKGFELILSHPVTRTTYFLGKLVGYAVIALVVTVAITVGILIFSPGSDAIFWSISLYFELLIIISVSLLCVFTLNSVTQAFSVMMGFYLLSRSIQTIQLMSEAPIFDTTSVSHRFMDGAIELLAYVMPDLSRFTRTEWLIYGIQDMQELSLIAVQSVIYILLLCVASLFDLYRKEL